MRTAIDATEIIPGLAIGGAGNDPELVRRAGYTLHLNVAHDVPQPRRVPGLTAMKLWLTDIQGHLPNDDQMQAAEGVVRLINQRITAGQATLITCAEGRNRSALVAGWVLVARGYPGVEAVELLRRKREPDLLRLGRLPAVLSNTAFVDFLLGR